MITKVCGMRDAQNIRDVEALGIDWIGMIFWPKSKRYVAEVPSYLPEHLKKVGVFVDSTLDDILQHISDYQLDIIQLHGQESPDFAKALKPHTIIKAFNIEKADDLLQTEKYEGIADYFLFDTRKPPREVGGWLPPGGTGEKFDWSVLTAYQGKTPFLLSGGIGPEDAESVKSFHHPRCFGIDLNSRFESEPGFKDINQLKTFINKLRYE
jgi:phosphoribosylanthranilate isomerase